MNYIVTTKNSQQLVRTFGSIQLGVFLFVSDTRFQARHVRSSKWDDFICLLDLISPGDRDNPHTESKQRVVVPIASSSKKPLGIIQFEYEFGGWFQTFCGVCAHIEQLGKHDSFEAFFRKILSHQACSNVDKEFQQITKAGTLSETNIAYENPNLS